MSGFQVLSRTFVTITIFYIGGSGGKRKSFIIPAFREFEIPGLNLAEIGHSMIKTKNKMWLSMATYRDVCFFIIQDQEHIGYQQNTVKSSGKGPNLLAQKLKMNKTEKNYIKQCVRSLEEGNIIDNEDGENAKYFLLNKKAKYLNSTT